MAKSTNPLAVIFVFLFVFFLVLRIERRAPPLPSFVGSSLRRGSSTISPDPMASKKEKAPPPFSKPAKSVGGKQKKKKWGKGKQKEKVNNMVLFDKATYDKLLSEAPKFKLITPSILSDRLRVFLFLYILILSIADISLQHHLG
ncbi:unnamed protein product [Lactuca saligna]|uniref:40S ribosomal protein S25 n=1 Tax=Lactuca saligna TaxID=75948 RepID=A0AA36EQH3_LACSI|nr:unnamed protein product [Lactuca saligna]